MSKKRNKKNKQGNKAGRQAGPKAPGDPSRQTHPPKASGLPVVIDGEPVRRAARQAHEKVRTQMEVMEQQIKNFEQQELPAFQRWMYLNFGPMLTELRELEQAVAGKEIILERVEDYQDWGNLSSVQAYARVKSEMENPDPEAETNSPDEYETADLDGVLDEEEEDLRDIYEAASKEFELETGSQAPDYASFLDAMGLENRSSKSNKNKTDSKQSRIKTIYRRIARSLHPDCSDQFSLREQRLWHRAQEAYKAGDLVGLETVLSHIEAAASGPLFASSVSDLLENTREMRARVGYLDEDLRRAREHPAWRFTQKNQNQLRSLHKRGEKELTLLLRQTRIELAAAEEALLKLEVAYARKIAREKARKSKKTSRVTRQATFQF